MSLTAVLSRLNPRSTIALATCKPISVIPTPHDYRNASLPATFVTLGITPSSYKSETKQAVTARTNDNTASSL